VDNPVLFSIVIPVKNGDFWLENLFQKLMEQTLFHQSEIIVLDSGSTDRSLEIISRYPVRLIKIPPGEFNHGDTRNVGAREAKGQYVVMTVQDAVPNSNLWLQYFLDGFASEKVAGVCGQQIVPHDLDKNPVRWFLFFSPPQLLFNHFDKPDDLLNLSPAEQRQKCGWDNVTAAYRRETLLLHPFSRIDFAEDICWAKDTLLKGYTLAHNNHARVYHYHHQIPEYVLPRYFSVYYFEYKIFKLKPKPDESMLRYMLLTIRILLRESSVSWPQKIKWFVFNARYRYALQKTIAIFNKAAAKGDAFLDMQYQQICKKPPQAPKY
jgi:rhamnosyltransferase